MKKQKVTFQDRKERYPSFTELFPVLKDWQDQAEEYRTRALALNWKILKVEIVNV
jgi:hypothetical protein